MKRLLKQLAALFALAVGVSLCLVHEAFAVDDVAAPATMTARRNLDPVTEPIVDRERRAVLSRAIADARRTEPAGKLAKSDLRAPMHTLVPLLRVCYQRAEAEDAHVKGVVNTKFTVDSLAGLGTIFTVRGFDTAGALGRSNAFRNCMKTTIEAIVLPPIGNGGSAEIMYPITFAPAPPDNRQTELANRAKEAADAGRWDDALLSAERGLELTSLDGTFRRRLIVIAGVAACHLKREAKARRYYALASATFEGEIREACARHAGIELSRSGAP